MKKRFISLLLVAAMLFAMLPQIVTEAQAATTLTCEPYAKVEFGYSSSVSVGTVRYISQIVGSNYFTWSYWPTPFGAYASPNSECGTASISMALSYIGKNITPNEILSPSSGGKTYFGTNWGGATALSYSYSDLSDAVDKYLTGSGKYSPPIIHLDKYSTNGHFVVIVGKVNSNTYQVLDPGNSTNPLWTITINGASATYNHPKSGAYISDKISGKYIWQYYNASAELPKPGKPSLSYPENNDRYLENSEIMFFWWDTANTTHYNLYFDQYINGEYERILTEHYASAGYKKIFDPGSYRVCLQSTNSADWSYTDGDWIYFEVLDADSVARSERWLLADNGHAYELYDVLADPFAAQEFCESRGGYLATISDAEENNSISRNIGGDSYLIGLTDSGTEGSFNWMNGETSSYRNWASGEPNDSDPGEDFVTISGSDQMWNDTWRLYPFVCEYSCTHPTRISVNRKNPTCQTTGYSKHWVCESCGQYFSDGTSDSKTTWSDLVLDKVDCMYNDGQCIWCGELPQKVIDYGYCGGEGDGTNLFWTLSDDGTLTITGTGAMENYIATSNPWNGNNKAITKVMIGRDVTTFSVTAFEACYNLADITVEDGNSTFCSEDGVLFNRHKTGLIRYPLAKTNSHYTIPDTVTVVGKTAFSGCKNLTTVTIPDSVITIDEGAFIQAGLLSVVIPDSVTYIGPNAFFNCFNLTSVVIGSGLTLLENGLFYFCYNLADVYFKGNAPTIKSTAFDGNGITIHYISGTSGWTDSEAYDAVTGTWNGYKLAIWEEKIPSFTVTFDTNGGSAVGAQTVKYGETVAEPTAPTKDGFTFAGWFNGDDKFDFSTPVTSDLTLVAKYEENLPVEPIPYEFTTSMTAALELESEVFLNVAPQMTDTEGNALSTEQAQAIEGNVGMLIWDAATAPAEADATIDVCDNIILGATYNTSTKRFDIRSEGIAAKNLGDNLTIRSFYTDGEGNYIYGKYVASYSPKKYCYSQIDKNAATKDVCIALLNYGAAAQTYFSHNTDNLMNAELTAEQQSWDWDDSFVRDDWSVDSAKEGGLSRNKTVVNSRAGSLELEGAINVVFSGGVKNIGVVKAELLIWDETAYNAVDVLSEENASEVVEMTLRADGKYEYIYEGVAAKEMFKIIYSCQKYTDTDGNVYYGGVMPMCAERYGFMHAEDGSDLGALAQCMILYGDAARAYFK